MTAPVLLPAHEVLRAALVPALRPYLEVERGDRPVLVSPWVHQIPLLDPEAANQAYAAKAPAFAAAVADADWVKAIAVIEPRYQVPFIHKWFKRGISVPTLRRLLGRVLCRLECPQLVAYEVIELLQSTGFVSDADARNADRDDHYPAGHRGATPRPTRNEGGSEEWNEDSIRRAVLSAAPRDVLTIYRGTTDPLYIGIAWNRDREVARRFAPWFQPDHPVVYTGQVRARDVLAAFDYESTILVDPARVWGIRREAA